MHRGQGVLDRWGALPDWVCCCCCCFVWLWPRIYHCSSWKNNRYNHRTSNLFSSAAVRGELPALVLHVTHTISHGFSRLYADNFTLMEKWCKRDKGCRIFREKKHDGIYMASFAHSFFHIVASWTFPPNVLTNLAVDLSTEHIYIVKTDMFELFVVGSLYECWSYSVLPLTPCRQTVQLLGVPG